jgi:antitoxin component YwqK of YwqJK toxin-antitoxin module
MQVKKMMKAKYILIILVFITGISCAQKDMYDLEDYKEIKRGIIMVDEVLVPNVIILQNKFDTNYTAKLTYDDTTYTNLSTTFFYYQGIANGPFKSYTAGRLFVTGYYKQGKREGERIVYGSHFIRNRQFFKNGLKTGTWEEYDDNGRLKRKTIYDDNGNLKKDIPY